MLLDADPRAKTGTRKVLWEQDEPTVSTWDVHSMSPVAGQSTVYVLLLEMDPKWYVRIRPLDQPFRKGTLPTLTFL